MIINVTPKYNHPLIINHTCTHTIWKGSWEFSSLYTQLTVHHKMKVDDLLTLQDLQMILHISFNKENYIIIVM